MASRTYDLSITFDNYYSTPKLWLFGHAEDGSPLTTQQIFQDISEDHARKTVTVDYHPHMGGAHTWVFIHPCKHSSVIKSFTDRIVSRGGEPRVDHYMFIFLKMMSSVLPTIDYDLSPGLLLGL